MFQMTKKKKIVIIKKLAGGKKCSNKAGICLASAVGLFLPQKKEPVACSLRCSAQRRQGIRANRTRKSARARDIFGSGVKSRIVGAVVQKVKKKK